MALAANYQVSDFRNNLKQVLKDVNENGRGISLLNRNDTMAVLLQNVFEHIVKEKVDYSKWLSLMFTERFLSKAPSHIKEHQIKEFELVKNNNLISLLNVKSLPIKGALRSKVIKQIGKTVIERLEKRYKISQAIIDAEKENLYDAIEHQTGSLK